MNHESKYVIVGFPKCGQISLETHLKKQGYDVVRHDIIWKSNARNLVVDRFPDRIPIIITRNPIDMIWSSYHYWHYKNIMDFEEYLQHRVTRESSLGNENPLEHADYEKHINKFIDLKPELFKFEDQIKIPGYPHENKTEIKPTMPLKYRELTQECIDSYQDLT